MVLMQVTKAVDYSNEESFEMLRATTINFDDGLIVYFESGGYKNVDVGFELRWVD